MIFLDEPNRLSENAKAVEEEFRQSCRNRQEKGEQNLSEGWMCSWEEVCHKLNKRNCVSLSALEPPKSRVEHYRKAQSDRKIHELLSEQL